MTESTTATATDIAIVTATATVTTTGSKLETATVATSGSELGTATATDITIATATATVTTTGSELETATVTTTGSELETATATATQPMIETATGTETETETEFKKIFCCFVPHKLECWPHVTCAQTFFVMCEEKIRKYIACIKCEEIPRNKSLYTCTEGHSICSTCNKRNNHKCVCGSQLMRFYNNEEFTKGFRPISAPNRSTSSLGRNNVLQLHPSQTSINPIFCNPASRLIQRDSSRQISKRIQFPKIQMWGDVQKINCSRPLECPITDCSKLITLSSLILHFSFDHPKIIQQYIHLDESKVLQLSLPELEYGKSVCLALLLLNIHKDSELSVPPFSSDIAFPILASRILCKAQTSEKPSREFKTTEQNRYTKLEKCYTDFDMFIVWICGNSDQLNCLIETANVQKGVSYCYTGPVSSLRDLNDPTSVFLRSDCLVLHTSSLDKISFKECEDGRAVCEIRIIISKR